MRTTYFQDIILGRNETMKQKVEFEDDILIIDELEDGETYHVTVPSMHVNMLTKKPQNILVYDQHIDGKIKNLLQEVHELNAKIHLLENQKANQEIRPHSAKMFAAIRLITADTSIYHRFWGEVRTVSVDNDGNVFFGPRAMDRERPDEQPKPD